jgi:hypothetical protein
VFREVAGDLADYFDPFSSDSICASATRVLSGQKEWRRKIQERRAELAGRFGPQTQARDFLAFDAAPDHSTIAQTASAKPPAIEELSAHRA